MRLWQRHDLRTINNLAQGRIAVATEAVDCLLGITEHHQFAAMVGERGEQLSLRSTAVLILVH
jgi:hypothetical protein